MRLEINNFNTAVVYVRVSSDEQVANTSLDSQKRYCREFAERNSWDIKKVFIEEGESAKTAVRTEFNKALAYATDKKNKIGFFLVYKLDRFARNQDDHAMVSAVLRKNGVRLRSATEPIDDTAVGRLTEGMLAAIAEFDNNIRAERTKNGMMRRIEQGHWVWPTPIGYHRPVKGKGSIIFPDPDKAMYVKMIFEEYVKGGWTYRALAEFVSERGFRTNQGKKVYGQMIYKILTNHLYCGLIKVNGQIFDNVKFEPIISKELFYQCQPNYKKSSHSATRSVKNEEFPLRRLFNCTECGKALTGSNSTSRNGKKHAYYHHQKQGCSKAKFIPKITFEKNFVEFLEKITPDERYEKLFKAVVVDIWQTNYKQLDNENFKIRKEIEQLEQDRQKIFEFHKRGVYSDTDLQEQKELINQRINEKRLLIQGKAAEEMNMDEALEYCFKFVRDTAKVWQILEKDYLLRQRFQTRIFPDGKTTFDGEKIGTNTLSPIYRINKELSETKKTSSQKSSLLADLVGQNWNTIVPELKRWMEFRTQLSNSHRAL